MNWTDPFFKFVLAGALLGATSTLLLWLRVRVVFFRQDLFVIRNQLWDVARRRQALDEPGYLYARQRINYLIMGAGVINYPLYVFVRRHAKFNKEARMKIDDSPMAEEIQEALAKTNKRLWRYMHIDQPITGILGRILQLFMRLSAGRSAVTLREWLFTDGPAAVAKVASQTGAATTK